jgi:hypothetical protein
LFSKFTEINEFQVFDPAESFFGISKVFRLKGFNSQSSPILFSYSKTRKLVSHLEVFALKESKESRGLRDIDSIHVIVVKTENLAALKPNNIAWQSLLLCWQVSALYKE